MGIRSDYLRNRYYDQTESLTYVQQRIYGTVNESDKFSAGTIMLAMNVNTWCNAQLCACYILCPGVCYPASCFAPVSISIGTGPYISQYCNPFTVCCFCNNCCTDYTICSLGTNTCWTPLSKMVGHDAGLVMRVN